MRSLPFILFLSAGLAPVSAQEKIPVLLVSGANNHEWEWTTPSLEEILTESGRFEVTVTKEPAVTLADANALAGYPVILLDYNGPRWGEPAETNFLEAVKQGTGVSVIHAANNAFPGWVEYETLVGLCWRAGTGHGRFHPFDVKVVDRDHPITRALPTLRTHPDELYHRLVPMHDAENRVLAAAYSDPETGGSGADEPMIVVQRYGRGRVFHTPLGHVWRDAPDTRLSHGDPQFRNLVVRGTEWAATGQVTDGRSAPNRLSALERRSGWRLLFDGRTTAGWRGHGRPGFPGEGWEVVDGCLRHAAGGGGGAIVTDEVYLDFELELEWKVAAGANSGVKYRVREKAGQTAALGPEYQVLARPLKIAPKHAAGALYALYAPEGGTLAATGAFNHSRIVARGDRIEHWLNGERIVVAEVGSDDWNTRLRDSKFADVPEFGRGAGPIALQDHGDEVWFRSLKIRDLSQPAGEDAMIFNGEDLGGWTALGDAVYTVEEGAILGRTGGGSQSFLATDRTFGDFVFEVDVRTEDDGNSGIQVRSHENERGLLTGYQIEIDPSKRAWSGGLYDEARRGWLHNLKDNPAGRAAYRHGEWNRYRIECVGPWVRAWVNGVPTADHFDPLDLEGVIGLQVHGGNNTRVRWRAPRLLDLGQSRWETLFDGETALRCVSLWKSWGTDRTVHTLPASGAASRRADERFDDFALRVRFRDPDRRLLVKVRADEFAQYAPEWRSRGITSSSLAGIVIPLAAEAFSMVHQSDTEDELVVSCFGPRMALHLNGNLCADFPDVPGRATGNIVLAYEDDDGAPIHVTEIAILETPGD